VIFQLKLPIIQNGFLVCNVHIPLGTPLSHKTHLMYELKYMEIDHGLKGERLTRALNPEPLNSCPNTWKNCILK
jgi:hypothetical protein